MGHLDAAMGRPASELEAADPYAAFVSAALRFADQALFQGKRLERAIGFLERGLALCRQRADRRHFILLQLSLGHVHLLLNRPRRAFSALTEGAEAALAIGDDDIMAQAGRRLSLYYFLQSRYRDALHHAESALKRIYARGDKNAKPAPITVAALSAAFLGQFHRAVGLLDFHIHFVRQTPCFARTNGTHIPRATLGMVLDLLGKSREARFHLDAAMAASVEAGNISGRVFALSGLAFHFYKKGDLNTAVERAGEIRTTAGEKAARFILTPWVLEMYHDFEKRGFGRKIGWRFQPAYAALMDGPNVHLRGTALRLMAADALARGAAGETVKELLIESETLLKTAGDPVQLARTRIDMARLKRRAGDREGSYELAMKARNSVAGYDKALFPNELKELLGNRYPPPSPPLSVETADEQLDRIFTLFEEMSGAPAGEFVEGVLSATSRFFRAEHSALFRFVPGKDAPDLLAAWNLTDADIQGDGFRDARSTVRQAFRENRPVIIRDGSAAGKRARLSAVCLPFDAGGGAVGVLYHENEYLTDELTIDESVMGRLSRLITAYIRQNRRNLKKIQADRDTLRQSIRRQAWTEDVIFPTPGLTALGERGRRAAESTTPVLITGETGTGKEVLAHWLHEQSPRRDDPFIVLEPTAIPATLIESDLFGHEKGAFTGADRRHIGKVELAHGGTLFIDEVGEIPKSAQVKLLRVLEDKSIRRIGGRGDIRSDFRLMAATNRNLADEVARGRFREDLFYRLNVIDLTLPPLRDRPEDIPPLARHFLARFARKNDRPRLALSPGDEACLSAYDWPGNVRELRNVIDRSALLTTGETLQLDLPSPRRPCPEPESGDWPDMDELQRRYIRAVLEKTGGKISGPDGAAEILGMKRATLYARMGKLGLR